ncbi:E7 [Human papillomavirus type 194]|jgi:hypothetical protein|nr:E7 [Human papillomavirus type 194]
MRGNVPNIHDIELDLQELVLPVNVLSEEVIVSSDDEEQEEEELVAYRIDTCCHSCRASVRFTVFAKTFAIRLLEQLILDEGLSLCCPSCARSRGRNGRR